MKRKYGVLTIRMAVPGLLGLVLMALLVAQEGPGTESARRRLFPIDPKAYLLGQFRPDTTRDFLRLPRSLTAGRSAYLRTEAAEALIRMAQAALTDGVRLKVVSATRSFDEQRAIWDAKFTGSRRSMGRNLARDYPDTTERCLAILQYSSAPGISRHHWGTDVDLNSTDPAYWRTGSGLKALHWLERQALDYGFVMAYPPDRERGHRYEPWHWSYQPLARPLLRNYYRRFVSDADLDGFLGAAAVRQLPWQEWYVYGVAEVLR
ncbi:MAG: M15 family metallopeptidase [Candidatus Neomarinimicrobiota bacterium]